MSALSSTQSTDELRRQKQTVVLVQPPCSFELQGESVLNTQFESIGLLALAAFLRRHGFEARIFHFARALELGFKPDVLFNMLSEPRPLVVGVSVNWLHLSRGALEVAEMLRLRLPDVPVVFGGQHASFFSEEIVNTYHDIVDGVVIGEGEETLLEVAERATQRETLHGVPGLMTYCDGEICYTHRLVEIDLDSLPLMSYEGIFPPPVLGVPAQRVAALDTSRGGCRKDCTYCLESSSLGAFGRAGPTHYSADRLFEQIAHYIQQGRDWITIQDQLFTHGSTLLTALLDRLNAADFRLKHLSLFLEPGSYGSDVYDRLDEVPADEVVLSFGVETGSPAVARHLRRFHDNDRFLSELDLLSRKRILSSTWWMVGLPDEGPHDIELTRRMIIETMRLGVHPKWVTPLILFPQTELARSKARFGIRQLLSSFEDFSRFSVITRNEYGVYPELITHESDVQSARDTLRYLLELKTTIEDHYPVLDSANAGKTDVSTFARFRRSTFF